MSQTVISGPLVTPATPTVGNDVLYEVVNGQRVELLSMGAFESVLASVLLGYLQPFAKSHRLGRAVTETLFRLNAALGLERRPDLAFVSYQRWPRNQRVPRVAAWEVVPDLAAEVVSPSNSADEVLVKIREYFQAGVRLVWVVYAGEEQIYVYTSPSDVHVLTRTDELDGGPVVPGFRLPVAALFDEEIDV